MNIPKPPVITEAELRDAEKGTYAALAKCINARITSEWNKLFEGAIEVTGIHAEEGDWMMSDFTSDLDTHRAIMLKPAPIKQGVTKEEIVKVLSDAFDRPEKAADLARRIEKEGIV